MANKNDSNRLNLYIEKIAFFAIFLGVTTTAGFQWQLYKDNQDILNLLTKYDERIERNEARITKLESEMLTWAVLKRIELYLSGLAPETANSQLLRAIRAESDARDSAKKNRANDRDSK